MKYILTAIFFMLSLAAASAAPTLGFYAKGPWGVCLDAPKAYHIVDLFKSAGRDVSSDVFWQYVESGDCYVLGPEVEFFLQAVVHRRGDARVVRVADPEGNLWYWLTTLPITGEPMPLDKDV
jgi:hypothetical protein